MLMTSDNLEDGYNDVISAKEIYTETIVKQCVYMSCHHSLGATGVTLNTRNASS